MKACWSKAPDATPGQRKALTVIVDGDVLPNRFPCGLKAYTGYGARQIADTDRRWSGTVVSDITKPSRHAANLKEPLCVEKLVLVDLLICDRSKQRPKTEALD
jgi:hypothetical protein